MANKLEGRYARPARRRREKAARQTRIRYRRPFLYAKQEEFLFTEKRISVVEASTKTGKTVGCIVWIIEKACLEGHPGWNGWWVAPIYKQAAIAFRRMKRMIPAGMAVFNDSNMTVTLLNGATIWCKGADNPDSLYGEDVHAAVIDEATRCKEGAWHAIRSTLTATRGQVRIIGNVKGRRNWAFQLARLAESGDDPSLYYAKLTAWDAVAAGVLAREEIEEAARLLPEAVFRELYLAEPSDDGGNPFGLAAIAACVAPLATGPLVGGGVDLAKHVDWTVEVGLNARGQVAHYARYQQNWTQTTAALDLAFHRHNRTHWLMDATGVGDPIVEGLQRGRSNVEGFVFTGTSKQQLMEQLVLAIQSREITVLDGQMRLELEQFEYEYTRTGVRYTAPEGYPDDTVMALALAVEAKKRRGSVPSMGGAAISL